MRAAWMLGGSAVLLVWVAYVHAEPKTDTITLPEVQVRSGPSPEFYPVSKLHQGDKIRVVRVETTGWLAIEPPPRSFSWIDARLVEPIGAHAVVVSAAEAPLLVGSWLLSSKPTVSRTWVKKGTQLTVFGPVLPARDGRWLPILPAPAEVRYIPADAIQALAAATPEPRKPSPIPTGFDSPRPAPPGLAPVPLGNASASASPPASSGAANGPWLQAEEAERAGDFTRAKQLWEGLAEQVKATDHDLWVRCLNRLQALQDRRSEGFASSPTGFQAAANFNNGAASRRLVPTAPGFPAPLLASPAPSQYCYVPDSGYTAKLSPPVVSEPSPPAASGQWSEPGRLRRAPFSVDGKPLFCLQPLDTTKRHLYVTAGTNVNLEAYIEKQVCLYGPVVYRGELRTNHMIALQVCAAH